MKSKMLIAKNLSVKTEPPNFNKRFILLTGIFLILTNGYVKMTLNFVPLDDSLAGWLKSHKAMRLTLLTPFASPETLVQIGATRVQCSQPRQNYLSVFSHTFPKGLRINTLVNFFANLRWSWFHLHIISSEFPLFQFDLSIC